MTETLGEACVDSLHDLDVFGGDAEVVEVDLEVPISKVLDLEIFTVVFGVVVAVGRYECIVYRRWGFDRGVGLRSARVCFLLRCHVVVSRTNRGWAPKLLV